ncbi:ribonuclease H-like domain-containing protein [Tanacetum coccineum]|uniref:Ribonuclease H-like domain-containing protein n=1 Tax=Tanacetum coccineum TaxID=301880 RepID=A0ABQ5D2B8_9ASTR
MVVIWNPSVRKSVSIVIPRPKSRYIVVDFGVCPDSNDPKLVRIAVDRISIFVNGVIYFRAYDGGSSFNIVISFDFKSENFGEVCLPERLVHTPSRYLHVAKVNESLGLLEYYNEGDMRVCGVWKREDGANKTFSKIYTVKVEGRWLFNRVLGFRNNGEVVIELTDDDGYKESGIEVYEPLSGHTNGVGINGKAWNASEGGLVVVSLFPIMAFVETHHILLLCCNLASTIFNLFSSGSNV